MTRRVFERRTRLGAPAEEVYGWHARPGAFERLSPPWDPPLVESRTGSIADERARVVLRVGPLRQRWVAEHYGAVPGREFHDRQLTGPFALWEHTHRMLREGPSACTLEDRIEYALPAGPAGDLLGGWAVRALLDRMFAYRHRVTADDLAAHVACRGGRAMKVAIAGSSGLVGSALVPFLTAGGHDVVRLVRRAPRGAGEVRWDPQAPERSDKFRAILVSERTRSSTRRQILPECTSVQLARANSLTLRISWPVTGRTLSPATDTTAMVSPEAAKNSTS